MSKANLCSEGETSPYNIYKFSGKLLDIDGDGFIDHIMRIPGVVTYYKRNITGDYGLLNKITSPQGGSINLEYKEMKGTEGDPHFKRVLSKVEYNDNCRENGLKDIEHGAHKIVTCFDYENSFYDRDIKESYGFEKVYTYTGFDKTEQHYTYDNLHRFILCIHITMITGAISSIKIRKETQ